MAIYRSKPVFISAFQYDGDLKGTDGKYYVPDWAVKAFEDGYLRYKDAGELYLGGQIVDLHVKVGDYLIRRDNGCIDVMDAEIFEANYIKEPEIKSGSAADTHW